MFEEAISKKTFKALALVAEVKSFPKSAYLAGGTAAALHLGHRYSYDLDFFTPKKEGIASSLPLVAPRNDI